MGKITLSPRLRCIASFVRERKRLVDIGTDHAYLPAYLAERKKIAAAIAADIRPGPLAKAAQTIARYQLEQCIETRLSDGLKAIRANEAEDIVIAGMGGELITAILSACDWVKLPDKRYILQPMTHSEILRAYLYREGFSIIKENIVCEGNKTYVILYAAYTGQVEKHTLAAPYIGALQDFSQPAHRRYLAQQIRYLSNKLLAGPNEELNKTLQELKALYDNSKEYL